MLTILCIRSRISSDLASRAVLPVKNLDHKSAQFHYVLLTISYLPYMMYRYIFRDAKSRRSPAAKVSRKSARLTATKSTVLPRTGCVFHPTRSLALRVASICVLVTLVSSASICVLVTLVSSILIFVLGVAV